MSITTKQNISFFNLEELQFHLGGIIEVINGIHTLHFDNENGYGRIRYVAIDDVLITINLEVNLTKNLTFSLGDATTKAIYFVFCLEGHCSGRDDDAGAAADSCSNSRSLPNTSWSVSSRPCTLVDKASTASVACSALPFGAEAVAAAVAVAAAATAAAVAATRPPTIA